MFEFPLPQIVKFGVWDHDPEKNEFIGQIFEKFNQVAQLSDNKETVIRWYNMYGAPEFKQVGRGHRSVFH